MIAGARPEAFEDAALVGEAKDRGHTFKAKIDLVESMGSELYAYFSLETERVQSKELEELAADSGAAEVPGGGDQVVARLDAASKVERGARPSSGSTPRPCTSSTPRTANGSGPSRDRRAPAPYGL